VVSGVLPLEKPMEVVGTIIEEILANALTPRASGDVEMEDSDESDNDSDLPAVLGIVA
jgi:hypothetical protein